VLIRNRVPPIGDRNLKEKECGSVNKDISQGKKEEAGIQRGKVIGR
jgi:hypothetical protein